MGAGLPSVHQSRAETLVGCAWVIKDNPSLVHVSGRLIFVNKDFNWSGALVFFCFFVCLLVCFFPRRGVKVIMNKVMSQGKKVSIA